MNTELIVRNLGVQDYEVTWQRMQQFTAERGDATPDEFWVLQHPPVFTLGQAGKPEHLLMPRDIPVIKSDRGGQVTYHGPGQLVVYLLIDIRRRKMGARDLVTLIENTVVDLLAAHNVDAKARPEAPGVYVEEQKVAALGLRIRKGRSYHGLSLNVAMDLEPFTRINPCGYEGLQVVDLQTLGVDLDIRSAARELVDQLIGQFGYDAALVTQLNDQTFNN